MAGKKKLKQIVAMSRRLWNRRINIAYCNDGYVLIKFVKFDTNIKNKRRVTYLKITPEAAFCLSIGIEKLLMSIPGKEGTKVQKKIQTELEKSIRPCWKK